MTQTTKHPIDDEANVEERASSVNAVSDIENQRQINDLRSEYLDDRSESINQWLVVIGLVLAFFAVAIPVVTGIAAYIAYSEFRSIESEAAAYLKEAKAYASEAAIYLKEIKDQKKIAEEVVSKLSRGDITKLVQSGPSEVSPEVESMLRVLRLEPGTSVIDKAIIEAVTLSQEGKIDDAIEKWRSIANISEGIDNDVTAGAFFARGIIKEGALGRHEEAISDLNEAIRLLPNYAEAYFTRGVSKANLGRHEEAISDLNEAIRLLPNYAEAYFMRGSVKGNLGKKEEAQVDYQIALKIAEQTGNEHLKTTIEERLQGFKDEE
ncbi:tetratricopeptide repeat protein [Candidatus Poribacteria bacterium]|nr:tetratricopeptide repeat protein [Candidatus Poribacteria bacterium]